MNSLFKQSLFIVLGWICVFLGIMGLLLPLMPGTVFFILALFLFAQSSERFHQMLLDNRWVGEDLKQWKKKKTISLSAFRKATLFIVLSFSVSIALLHDRPLLQLILICIAAVLLWYLKRICEPAEASVQQDQ